MNRRLEKIIWNFADWCLNTPLLEMTSERNSKLEKIESKSETINTHLFKYFLMPNSIDRKHWLNEINDRFFEIHKLVWGKNKRFRSDEYFKILYFRFYIKDEMSIDYRYLESIFSKIEEMYKGEFQREYTINDFVDKISHILKKISDLLEDGNYDKSELINLMKTLN